MENTTLLPTSQPAATLQVTPAAAANGNRSRSQATSPLSVRKPPGKAWKRPPALPIPPKVYRVHPWGFRQLVQSLTGATSLLTPRHLPEVPPPVLPPPPQQPAGAPMVQAFLHGVAPSLPSSSPASTEFPPGVPAERAVVPPVNGDTVAELPSPSLYSACLTCATRRSSARVPWRS